MQLELVEKAVQQEYPGSYLRKMNFQFEEFSACKTVIQRNGLSVCDHTFSVLDRLHRKNMTTMLSGIFHDLGKRHSIFSDADSRTKSVFCDHQNISVTIAVKVLSRLIDVNILDSVVRIIATHMYDIFNLTTRGVRSFVGLVGVQNIDDWFSLRYADTDYPSERHTNKINTFRGLVDAFLKTIPYDTHAKLDDGPPKIFLN